MSAPILYTTGLQMSLVPSLPRRPLSWTVITFHCLIFLKLLITAMEDKFKNCKAWSWFGMRCIVTKIQSIRWSKMCRKTQWTYFCRIAFTYKQNAHIHTDNCDKIEPWCKVLGSLKMIENGWLWFYFKSTKSNRRKTLKF